ncbi:MAG: alpha/beta hydrolase [Candidatus ainarchaeum sp.]|nr:alpha/beta hydrolase [Candidatus ainarchaeum sp.]
MTKVIIVHGWAGSPKEAMHAWMKAELEKKGFEVIVPKMPNSESPKIEKWIPFLQKNVGKLDEDTYFIGHSIGCQAIMRFLQELDSKTKIGGVVFIAPWMHLDENTIKEEGEESVKIVKPWVETPIDFSKIKTHTNEFLCIFSNNDPYVPFNDSEIFKEKLGAKIVVERNKGHFTEEDGIKENKTAVDGLLNMM